jgi:RNA polymerase sigma-70 factor (TIGR02943 family)
MSFQNDVASHRPYLMRFARLQLRNDAWAEDAVSETLLAALSKPQGFGAQSQLKTWLVGILKHKVVDLLRSNLREVNFSDLGHAGDDDSDPLESIGFKPDGHFAEQPAQWGNPDQSLDQKQFFAVMDACVEKLPATQGRLFLMREWLEMDCEEVCKELQMTSTNLYVQLHRARLRLRACLELNWYGITTHVA